MRALIQRVRCARVTVDDAVTGRIDQGFLILLGVHQRDHEDDALKLAEKTTALRIFEDTAGKMNRSLNDIGGQVLIISQFTLYADTRKGNRPSFTDAAAGPHARALYETYTAHMQTRLGIDRVATGVFAADMQVELVNDGPVTIMLETQPTNNTKHLVPHT